MSDLSRELKWRGLQQDATQGAEPHLAEAPRSIYIGFDPTARSLHVGSLLVISTLALAQRCGHTPIALVGGGTGLIGDPSGKSDERNLLSEETAMENGEAIGAQLAAFLDFSPSLSNRALVCNNLDWLGGLGLVPFLRDIGKHFSVNRMVARESVKRRVETSESGISFTEFSYSLLQAYDFLELYRRHGCTVQMGGSDQWGNITAGTELVRKVEGVRAFGVVSPLVTNSSGTKFGKTESGNVWLDPELTSPYEFYQFWLNTADADVVRHLKAFTLLGREEIDGLAAEIDSAPHRRVAQRALAAEVTRRVHGDVGLAGAERATRAFFGGELRELSEKELGWVFADAQAVEMERERLAAGVPVTHFAVASGVAGSLSDARRRLAEGSFYLNNVRVTDPEHVVATEHVIGSRYIVARRGKKRYVLVRVVG